MHWTGQEPQPLDHGPNPALGRYCHDQAETTGDCPPSAQSTERSARAYDKEERVVCVNMRAKERIFDAACGVGHAFAVLHPLLHARRFLGGELLLLRVEGDHEMMKDKGSQPLAYVRVDRNAEPETVLGNKLDLGIVLMIC